MDPVRSESVSDLQVAFAEARSAFEDALRLADGRWEEPLLEPEDGADEAWAPHMAVAHALLGERWRFRYLDMVLSTSADAPPPTFDDFAASPAGQEELDERRERYEALDGVEPALEAAAREWAVIDRWFERRSDEDLGRAAGLSEWQLGYIEQFGQRASNDVRGCLVLAVVHLADHAEQLRTALTSEFGRGG
jgi:hypothetical protein